MSTTLFNLEGKIALVTGASRGIGEEIARLLAEQGAHVIVSSRKIDGCQAVADAIKQDGGSAEAFPCHIGEMAQIQAIFSHIRDVHGKLDILVNNAAANPFFGHILDTPVDAFDKTVDVNLRGYFYMSFAGHRFGPPKCQGQFFKCSGGHRSDCRGANKPGIAFVVQRISNWPSHAQCTLRRVRAA